MKSADLFKNGISTKSLSKEGYETKRIKRGQIAGTLQYISKHIGVPTRQLHKLGSTGKLQTSGDIDIAIDSEKFGERQIGHRLKKLSKGRYKEHKGIKVTSYAIPIRGDEEQGLVQVDVVFTPNTNWAKFAYHSEGEGTKYKGALRGVLLSAVAKFINKPGMDHIEYDDEDHEITIQAGRSVELSQGMLRTFKHRPLGKDGNLVKNPQSIPIEKFKELYPNVEVKGGQVIVDDPEKVVKLLFGSTTKPDDVRTVEQILRLIKRKFDDETQDKIFKHAAKKAKPLTKKMRIPPELEEHLDETE